MALANDDGRLTEFTPAAAAKYLGKSYRFVLNLIEAGELDARDERAPGSTQPRWMIPKRELDDWLNPETRRKPIPVAPKFRMVPSLVGVLRQRREARAARAAKLQTRNRKDGTE